MSIDNEIKQLHEHVQSQSRLINHNSELFDMLEGDLLKYVLDALKDQINIESFNLASKRIPPINILVKFIDRLSKIYQQDPVRYVSQGSEADKELLSYYEQAMDINVIMNNGNEFFNLFKNTLIQPYVYKGKPRLRAIPSDSFTVFSDSNTDHTEPTHVITFHSIYEDGRNKSIYYVYTDERFFIFDDQGNLRKDLMLKYENPEGINIAGKIPFVYVNKSKNLLIPKADTDTKKMVVLLPVMLADLNFAVMMQAFSIIYGIDVDDTGIKMSPNAFWNFKSDESSDKTPQLGILKPQVDTESTLNLIQSEISLWMQTKGIKPGSVGKLTADNYASGISKLIDEMDTSEERQSQVAIFKGAEKNLWNLITKHMHPLWRSQNVIDTNLDFSSDVEIKVNFSEQLPILNRGEVVGDLKAEMDAGFISKKRAIKKLNPRMSDTEIDELLAEIEAENSEETDADI